MATSFGRPYPSCEKLRSPGRRGSRVPRVNRLPTRRQPKENAVLSKSTSSNCPSRRPGGSRPASRPCSAATSPHPPSCWERRPANSARPGSRGARSARFATSHGGYRTAAWTRTYHLEHLPTQEEVLGHRGEMAAPPQPGDQLPVLRRLRIGRGTTGRPTPERLNMNCVCTHLDRIHEVTPSSSSYEDCLAQGRQDRVHLRVCQECGHVGCSDNSSGRHATAPFHVAGSPVIRSYEPGEYWSLCYLDQLVFELQGAPPAPSHPCGIRRY